MTLEQIAQQAMDYLDSVGVAADYEIYNDLVRVITEDIEWAYFYFECDEMMEDIKTEYPESKERREMRMRIDKEIKMRIDKVKSPN
jgi:hypothetical protein